MRILFVEVDTERTWSVASIGPGFLAAFLRERGHELDFLRVAGDRDLDEAAAEIAGRDPELIGLSLTTRQWLRARDLVAALRRRAPGVPVIAGGLHPTFAPEAVLAAGFDFVCLGEGEEPLLDLARALEAGAPTDGIANIWTRGGTRPALRPPFSPLDDLPFIARDFLDEYSGVVHMTTQRGCPFPCTYCAARMYNQLYEPIGEYGRRRSHDDVLAELHQLEDDGRLAYVIFLDDTFTINHPWLREFCRRYGDEIGRPFSLHARVETVKPELLDLLAAAGCNQITYGVESGSERVRREIMRRPVTNQRFRDVFAWTRAAGIAVTANYMLGIPGETRAELDETLALAEELEVLDFGYFVFYPYPGTQLFQICRERGLLPEDYLERPANHRASILDLPDLTPEDIAEVYEGFTALRRRIYAARDNATEHVDELAGTG
jgi:radical SAM superfamily enzyme YgiQ (UPF0313 family)